MLTYLEHEDLPANLKALKDLVDLPLVKYLFHLETRDISRGCRESYANPVWV